MFVSSFFAQAIFGCWTVIFSQKLKEESQQPFKAFNKIVEGDSSVIRFTATANTSDKAPICIGIIALSYFTEISTVIA